MRRAVSWDPPEDWVRVRTLDAHTEGEPLRVIVAGVAPPAGRTILERRRAATRDLDSLRTALMWEPRGHADMYGCLIVPPEHGDGDFGVLFLHNEGFSTMCGHGIIAVTTVVLETGIMPVTGVETTVRIDTPAGRVTATASVRDGVVERVRFRNVPSFVSALDAIVTVPGLGTLRYDLAYGGAFYAYVDAADCGVGLHPADSSRLIELGVAIREAVSASAEIIHPEDPDLGFLYGTIFVGPAVASDADSRNVCVFADGEIDRSPTGTGVSGRMAIDHARGRVPIGEARVIESILGTRFTARVVDVAPVGPHSGVVPEVEGRAWLTGRHEFWIDPSDPLRDGFLVR